LCLFLLILQISKDSLDFILLGRMKLNEVGRQAIRRCVRVLNSEGLDLWQECLICLIDSVPICLKLFPSDIEVVTVIFDMLRNFLKASNIIDVLKKFIWPRYSNHFRGINDSSLHFVLISNIVILNWRWWLGRINMAFCLLDSIWILHNLVARDFRRLKARRWSPLRLRVMKVYHWASRAWWIQMTLDDLRLRISRIVIGHLKRSVGFWPIIGHIRHRLLCLLCWTLLMMCLSRILGRWGIVPSRTSSSSSRRAILLLICLEFLLGELGFGLLLKNLSFLVTSILCFNQFLEGFLHYIRIGNLLHFVREQVGHGFTFKSLDVLILEL